jgi:hypothetical protein
METLVLRFKNKKNYRLIKELAERLEGNAESSSLRERKKSLPKSKLTAEDLKAMGGILRGQLISKEHLRSIAWKKRNW